MSLREHARLLPVILVFCLAVAAQESKPATPPPPKQNAPEIGVEVQNAEKTITPEQARELFSAVDKILKFDSEDTALPIKHPVKRQLTDRDQVQRFLEARMKDDSKRMEQSAAVLEKFGLLPRGFDLQRFLVELLREQVAGYYDEHTRTVYMLNWVDAAGQKPVLAHELTHALQDQNFSLKKWLKDPDSKKLQSEVDSDEQTTARQAVVEGQAMITLMDFYLAPMGQSVANSPQLVDAMRAGMMANDGSPVFARAPLFLKEALTFPYNYGLNFERELLVKGGKQRAFADVFRNPPRTTREIMEPQTYMAGEKVPPLPVPDFDKLLGHDYKRFDVGAIGEFDLAVLMDQYGAKQARDKLASDWRGGYYYAARPKKGEGKPLGLVFVTKWANADGARRFATIYTAYLPKRYRSVTRNGSGWNTDEGAISIERQGDTLLVMESLDDTAAAKVRQAVLQNRQLAIGLTGSSVLTFVCTQR